MTSTEGKQEGRKSGGKRRQVAALPWRGEGEALRILLVSSRETRRWVIPKGWPMKDKADFAAAAQEAYEEAGLDGVIAEQPVGEYEYLKRLKSGAETAVSSMRAGQSATGTGVEASQRTGQSLSAITDQVEAISDMNHQVAAATEEQSSVTEEINRNVQGIADLAGATAGEVRGCREECQALSRLADDLAGQMGRFRL